MKINQFPNQESNSALGNLNKPIFKSLNAGGGGGGGGGGGWGGEVSAHTLIMTIMVLTN